MMTHHHAPHAQGILLAPPTMKTKVSQTTGKMNLPNTLVMIGVSQLSRRLLTSPGTLKLQGG